MAARLRTTLLLDSACKTIQKATCSSQCLLRRFPADPSTRSLFSDAPLGRPRPLSTQTRPPAIFSGNTTSASRNLQPHEAGNFGACESKGLSAAAAGALTIARELHSPGASGKAEGTSPGNERPQPSIKSMEPKKTCVRHLADTSNPDPQSYSKTTTLSDFVVPTALEQGSVYRCTAFCTADAYDTTKLVAYLPRHYLVQPIINEDVCHVRIPQKPTESGEPVFVKEGPAGNVFVFRNGTFVSWGTTASENNKLLKLLKEAPGVEVEPHLEYEIENCDYTADPNSPTGLHNDTIVLGNTIPTTSAMLSFSHGLARSAKLSVLETALDGYLADNRHFSFILMEGRKLPLDRADVLRKLGALLNFRHKLNLHHTESFLDTPDFYWSQPRLEECYIEVSKAFDVRPRISTLNKKLDYANELAQTLRDHLVDMHGTKLEWIIIVLIAIEVAFGFFHIADRMGYLHFLPAPYTSAHPMPMGTVIPAIPTDTTTSTRDNESTTKDKREVIPPLGARLALAP